MVKPCFIFVLLILFFVLFGLESIVKFQAKQTIVIESTEEYDEQDRPAITLCATTNGYTGWRNGKFKEKVLQSICNKSTNAEEALKCINDGTFDFSEMVTITVDGDKNVINETSWDLDLNSHAGKCQTLNTSVVNIGTDMNHPLTITYPNISVVQYTLVH